MKLTPKPARKNTIPKVALYRDLLYPLLSRFTGANAAHDRAVDLAAWAQHHPARLRLLTGLAQVSTPPPTGRLETHVGGIHMGNPFILAAGFDKDARCAWTLNRLGFGAVVVGTVLERPQPGNPPPTIFRPAPGVVLNRMGFPSGGLDAALANLPAYAKRDFPLGLSAGINKDVTPEDAPTAYATVIRATAPHVDFFEVNVSSPNTPGLRRLQNRDHLERIISAVIGAMPDRKPLWLKISPDLTLHAIDEVLEVALTHGVDAIVATNTTTDPAIKAALGPRWAAEAGGVSGPPLRERATAVVKHIAAQAGDSLDVVGCGGITDVHSVLEKLNAGAQAVALYTALVTHGPALPTHLARELDRALPEETPSP